MISFEGFLATKEICNAYTELNDRECLVDQVT